MTIDDEVSVSVSGFLRGLTVKLVDRCSVFFWESKRAIKALTDLLLSVVLCIVVGGDSILNDCDERAENLGGGWGGFC